jgi:hypothetical protein
MPSDFDRAFSEVQAQREAEARAKRSQEQEAERQQRSARSIAEPYLKSLAPHVRQRLRDMKIPLQKSTCIEVSPGWFKEHRRERQSEAFWPLDPVFYGIGDSLKLSSYGTFRLVLTKDGYFTKDYCLPGREGFEVMMSRIRMLDLTQHFPRPNDGEVFVDSSSHSVFIHKHYTDRYDTTREETHDIGLFIAQTILKLGDVEMNRRNRNYHRR